MDNSKAIEYGIKRAIEIKNIVVKSSLIKLCDAALLEAVKSHTFKNVTGNLEDSFTYGIFHNGVLIKSKSVGNGDGVEDANKFFDSYKPNKSWTAVIVAGAWYGALLENYTSTGWGKSWDNGGGKFIVLSDCFDYVVIENGRFFKKK